MKLISLEKIRNMRRDRNNELLRRMRNGDPLSRFDSYSSWFPPRPLLEKDHNAINRLYGAPTDKRLQKPKNNGQKVTVETRPLSIA